MQCKFGHVTPQNLGPTKSAYSTEWEGARAARIILQMARKYCTETAFENNVYSKC